LVAGWGVHRLDRLACQLTIAALGAAISEVEAPNGGIDGGFVVGLGDHHSGERRTCRQQSEAMLERRLEHKQCLLPPMAAQRA
jgi:hypothetical protein